VSVRRATWFSALRGGTSTSPARYEPRELSRGSCPVLCLCRTVRRGSVCFVRTKSHGGQMSIETFRAHCRLQLETPEVAISRGVFGRGATSRSPRGQHSSNTCGTLTRSTTRRTAPAPHQAAYSSLEGSSRPSGRGVRSQACSGYVVQVPRTSVPGHRHVSRDRIRFLVHVPHGEPGLSGNRTAEVVGSTDEYVLWIVTAPAAHVVEAVAASN